MANSPNWSEFHWSSSSSWLITVIHERYQSWIAPRAKWGLIKWPESCTWLRQDRIMTLTQQWQYLHFTRKSFTTSFRRKVSWVVGKSSLVSVVDLRRGLGAQCWKRALWWRLHTRPTVIIYLLTKSRKGICGPPKGTFLRRRHVWH